jgi:hypothetical protein
MLRRAQSFSQIAQSCITRRWSQLCSRSGWLGCCRDANTLTLPTQPQGADEHKTLAGCFGWVLTWPKTQMRLVKEQQVTQPPPRMEKVTEPTPCLAPVTEPAPPRMVPLPRWPKQVVSANTSRHQKLLAATLPQPPSAPHGKAIAASYPVLVEDINDDDDDNPDD